MKTRILQGDVFDILPTIKAGSVDAVVTSPPYWKLRAYLPEGHPLKHLEIGQEDTPAEYIDKMVRVCRLVRTCLADHALFFLNIGDTYSASGSGAAGKELAWQGETISGRKAKHIDDLPPGNLCLIPQRLMIALQDDGWVVRSVPIWWKPSCMPSSVSGWRWVRCRKKVKGGGRSAEKKAHTTNGKPHGARAENGKDFASSAEWTDCPGCKKCQKNSGLVLRRGSWRPTSSYEPVIMLAKTPGYYADGIAVKTPPKAATISRDRYTRILDDPDEQFAVAHDHETYCDGANLRDVWRIASEPLREGHYAAFPTKLVDTCLKAGTSERGYCRTCGAPWVRAVEEYDTGRRQKKGDNWDTGPGAHGKFHRNGREQGERDQPVMGSRTIEWRPSCECADCEPRPGLVLDPFAGSGRTAIAANRLNLDFIGVELNPQYAAMSERLVKADAPLFNCVE